MSTATTGFILNEDAALKSKLSGLSVINYADGSTVPVKVFYRLPDAEEIDRTFPHISIDLTGVEYDRDRAHRAFGSIVSWHDLEEATPQATPQPGFVDVAQDFPLPWMLIYQLTLWSRQPRHDRQLTALIYMMFPEQYGFLDMTNIDGTTRRADFRSAVRRDTVDNSQKRLYRNIVTVAVSAEFFIYEVQQIQRISSVNVDMVFDGQELDPPWPECAW